MITENTGNIKKVYWDQVRKQVASVNSEMANIIDEIDPGKKFPLYVLTYPYGAEIGNRTHFYYPINNQLLGVDNPYFPNELKKDLAYAGIVTPAGIVLKGSMELFLDTDDRVCPIKLFTLGEIFALWGHLDSSLIYHPSPLMSLTAGARNVFMLPNIGDILQHRNLKRDFNVYLPAPKALLDQNKIFSIIVKKADTKQLFNTQLLIFTSNWINAIKKDPSWQKLYLYLLKYAWAKTACDRNKSFYDFTFSKAQVNRNLKPNPYLADTVKHLIMIAIGAIPAFTIGIDDTCIPVSLIQQAYIESYKLKQYAPIIMHPTQFNLASSLQNVYYSLQYPTTLEFSPKSRKDSSTISCLSEIQHVLSSYLDEILSGQLKMENTILGLLAKTLEFDFFQCKPDRHKEIKLTKTMPEHDTALIASLKKYKKNNKFAEAGAFVRGCIGISHK